MAKPEHPLAGARVLVGRARHQASALSSALRELGAEVIEIPFIEIKPPKSFSALDAALKNLSVYDWLILTSVNGVSAVQERIGHLGVERSHPRGLKVAAIGPATRKAAEQNGFRVDLVPGRYVAESVVESLRSQVAGKRVLLARAKVARDVIPRELRRLGATVDVVEAYETVLPAASRSQLKALLADPRRRPHVVTFTSSSAVRNFVALRNQTTANLEMLTASIGPVTSATLREAGLPVSMEAESYTIPGLVAAMQRYFGLHPPGF
jgi:uroporphyrinogen-III synthase